MSSGSPTAAEERRVDFDESVVLERVGWPIYERLLALRGEASVPRMTYLQGTLEIMSPSRNHDLIKRCLGRLVEAWTEEKGIDVTGLGSWTLERKKTRRGLEPDECYLVGEPFDDESRLPDLAIEVAWSRWKVDKLEVYRGLGVREVWVWRDGRIDVYVLRRKRYDVVAGSEVLRGVDLPLFARLAMRSNQSAAVRELRRTLRVPTSRP